MGILDVAIKILHPICSSEAQILITQLVDNPSRFDEYIKNGAGRPTTWSRALVFKDSFGVVDRVVINMRLSQIKRNYVRQLVYEALLSSDKNK